MLLLGYFDNTALCVSVLTSYGKITLNKFEGRFVFEDFLVHGGEFYIRAGLLLERRFRGGIMRRLWDSKERCIPDVAFSFRRAPTPHGRARCYGKKARPASI